MCVYASCAHALLNVRVPVDCTEKYEKLIEEAKAARSDKKAQYVTFANTLIHVSYCPVRLYLCLSHRVVYCTEQVKLSTERDLVALKAA